MQEATITWDSVDGKPEDWLFGKLLGMVAFSYQRLPLGARPFNTSGHEHGKSFSLATALSPFWTALAIPFFVYRYWWTPNRTVNRVFTELQLEVIQPTVLALDGDGTELPAGVITIKTLSFPMEFIVI